MEESKIFPVISIFSGAMGLDNGIEKAGLEIRLAVEFEKSMADTIRLNKPNLPLLSNDILNYSGKDLLDRAGLDKNELFLLCGGPPCQAFSTAGKRKGFDDIRGNVFLKFIDLIDEMKPKYFLIENVRGLLSASFQPVSEKSFLGYPPALKDLKGTALLHILDKIKSFGYSCTFSLYDAANYGVPQRRERVILLGGRDGIDIPLIPPTHNEKGTNGLKSWVTLKDAIKDLTSCTCSKFPEKRLVYYKLLNEGQYWKDLPKNLQEKAMGASYRLSGGKTGFYRKLAWDKPSPTLVTCPTMPATDLCHPEENRPLSVEEYARIQMFPDTWKFSGNISLKYKQIGNAVPVGLAYSAAKHLLWFDSLSGMEKRKLKIIDESATYSRYKNTDHEYFQWLSRIKKNEVIQREFDFPID